MKRLLIIGAVALMSTIALAAGTLPTPNVAGLKVNGTTQNFPASGNIVGTSDVQTLTNKTLTGPSISGPSITGTVTVGGVTQNFPASGNLVGTSDVQTLTNKSISGSQINSGTIAPQFGGTGQNWSASSGIPKFTSGTASLVTAPAGTIVGTTDTQTLSGKTLASPTITGTVSGSGVIPNAALVNPSVTVSGSTCTLGSSCSPAASSVTVGTTGVTGGTNGQYLYNSSGVIGSAQAYNFNNIVGTVSQSAGVPTGAVIQTGSNANGSYTKFADGTMICTVLITATSQNWTAATGAFFTDTTTETWTYPVAFASVSSVTINATSGTNTIVAGASVTGWTTTSASYAGWASTALNSSSFKSVSLLAIGRWF